jgi:hypothetical protein
MPIADRQDSQSTAKTVEAPLRSSRSSIRLFISYAHRDEDLRLELDDQLSNLQRQQIISGWHDRRIAPGQEWADQIDDALNEAQIILLLISARFMASDYCYDKEMVRAIERHDAGEAVVIPIILSACDWQDAPFSKLQALPKDAKPIKNWNDRDEAWLDVVRGLRRVIDRLSRPEPTVETYSFGDGPPDETVPFESLTRRLHHRCNRSAQTLAFETAFEQHWKSQSRRPLVCLAHGDESECHDLLLDRLQHEILPGLLDVPIAECVWKEPPNPKGSIDEFWTGLGRSFLKERFKTAAETREQILKELDRPGRALLVRLQWYSEQFGSARTNGLANFMQFWENWPALSENCLVICALSLVYSNTKDVRSRLTFWQKSPADRLKDWVKEYEEGVQPALSFSLCVLPELGSVEHHEAKRWCDYLDPDRREQVKDQVIDFFKDRNNRPIDMRTLVKQLRKFLAETNPSAQSHNRS